MSMPLERNTYTYRDYLQWPEGTRVELINGDIVAMSPAPTRQHQRIAGSLYAKFETYLTGKPCEANIAPFDVRLPDGEEADDDIRTTVQPDITIVCDPSKLDDRGCKGAPDLVVEVISPSSLKLDLYTKKALYEKAGVREYWIVYPAEKIVLIHYLSDDGTYAEVETFTREDTVPVGIFADFAIQLGDIFTI